MTVGVIKAVQNRHQAQNQYVSTFMLLLEEEEGMDEQDILMIATYKTPNKNINDLFLNRKPEETYELTVQRRLFGNESKFREYFRAFYGTVSDRFTFYKGRYHQIDIK